MIFGKKEKQKRSRMSRMRGSKTLSERFYKMLFFLGLTVSFKGLKGMLRAKRQRMARR